MSSMELVTSQTPPIQAVTPIQSNANGAADRAPAFHWNPGAAPRETYASAFGPPNPAMTVVKQIESSISIMDSARQKVQEVINQPRLNPTAPGYMDQANREFAQFMDIQLSVSKAAFGLELASKTIEVGTNGINTLSRTQT